MKHLPDGHGFIQGPPRSGKTTIIKHAINAIVQIDQAQNEYRQILVCCASNDAVNNVCDSTDKEYPGHGCVRVYSYGVELQYVEVAARAYRKQKSMERSLQPVSITHNSHLVGRFEDDKQMRHHSLICIGVGERTLQRVRLRGDEGSFTPAQLDSLAQYSKFRDLFRNYNQLDNKGELGFEKAFRKLYREILRVLFHLSPALSAANISTSARESFS